LLLEYSPGARPNGSSRNARRQVALDFFIAFLLAGAEFCADPLAAAAGTAIALVDDPSVAAGATAKAAMASGARAAELARGSFAVSCADRLCTANACFSPKDKPPSGAA